MRPLALALVAIVAGCHSLVGIEPLRDPPPDAGSREEVEAGTGLPRDGGGEGAAPTSDAGSNLRVTSDCQDFTSHEGAVTTGPRLVLISHYRETNGSDVLVDTAAPIVLVLSSYEASHWKIQFAKGGPSSISKILLNGATSPQFVDPTSITLEQHQGTAYFGNVGWAWPGNAAEEDGDTQALVTAIEGATELKLAAFGGCRGGGSFVISGE